MNFWAKRQGNSIFLLYLSEIAEVKTEELRDFLALVKAGNQKAQTQLIHYYWEDVFAFVLKKVGDNLVADEITVAVFAKILAKLHLYDEQFQFKTWMLTIAQNSVIDYWRKKAREEMIFEENIEEAKGGFASSPEELLISKQQQQHITETINTMDMQYRRIVELRFFEEKSIKEIAEELNISVANTKVRIMRAKKILAELLKNRE